MALSDSVAAASTPDRNSGVAGTVTAACAVLPALLADSDAGVRVHVGPVVAGSGVVALDGTLENPPDDPSHCPPAYTWIGIPDGSRIARLRFHHPARMATSWPARNRADMRTSVNGTGLYFDVEGPELAIEDGALHRRPTIVVVHGGPGFDQGYLRPGLRPLTEVAQLVFVDLRGQGRSAHAAVESCTLEQMADDVAALCRQLGIERPTVFGHSAGGFVALQLTLRHPDVPAGLILCDSAPTLGPIPDDDPPPSLAERAGPEAVAAAERLFAGDFSAATLQMFQRLVVPHYAAPTHTAVPGKSMSLSTLNPEIAAHFFSELAARYDLRERLGEIDVPTLVMVGGYDWVCPTAASRAIADAIPGARLRVLPDAGHFGFSETPDPFLRAVRALADAAVVASSTAA